MMEEFGEHSSWIRRLEEEKAKSNNATGNSSIILNTLRVYGTFFAITTLLFEFLRRRYPRLYSIRSWVPEHQCDLAKQKYPKLFSWFWKVYQVPDHLIFDQCGMDALCFLRAIRFCRKLAIVGVANALWLIPVYVTAEESADTSTVTDRLDRLTLANVPAKSFRFFATVLAAYIMVLYTMYLLSKEFEWYTYWRHKFLSRRRPRNYAVYVYGIPKEFRSSHKLESYFRSCSSDTAVLEAHVAMDTPHLEKLQMEREKSIQHLEHAVGVEKRTGRKHFSRQGALLERVETVKFLKERIHELNVEIPRRIQEVTAINDRFRSRLTKVRSTRNLMGALDLDDDDENGETGFHLREATINENEPLDLSSDPDDNASSLFMDGTTATIPTDRHDSGESYATMEIPTHDRNMLNEEAHCTVTTDDSRRPEQQTQPNPTSLDSRDRAFLSIFLPDAESLVQNLSSDFPRRLAPETNPSGEQDDEEDDNECAQEQNNICESENEIPSTVYRMASPPDVEAPEFNASETENSGLDESAVNNIQNNHPGLDSKQSSSSTTASRRNKSALSVVLDAPLIAGKTFAKGTTAATTGLAKSTKLAGERLSQGAKLTGVTLTKGTRAASQTIAAGSRNAKTSVIKAAKDMKVDRLVHRAGTFVPIVLNTGEGEPRAGGFVVFTNLYTTQTALQMVHHAVPYTMEVQEAPQPGDIFWRNVGMEPSKRRLGRLYSVAASAFLCFFWSIPTAFVASLTSVSSLKEELPRIGDIVDKYPWFEEVLFQLAPMLLLFLNEVLLPEILKIFATWEGHISSVVLEASLFIKLSAFMIIQTFFVSALSGSIYAELTNMIKSPERMIDLLSSSLPSQSAYFMQIMFAATFLLQAIELLRLYPLGCALIRRCVGPNATEKERKKPWLTIYTLEEPPEFWHAETFAQIQILYVMVLLVYAVIAPITASAILFCFVILEGGYRYQFIHNYPVAFDTGGKLWFTFVQFVLASLLIAELTLAGLLALKQSKFAGPAIGPLIVLTVLFILFINSKHSHVMRFLPTRDCVEIDQANVKAGNTDFSFAKKEYLQPSLRKVHDYPEYDDDVDIEEM